MISLFGPPEPTLLEKLKTSVSKTKNVLAETVDNIFQGERAIDPALLKNLETALLTADLGVAPTREILDSVKEKLDRHALSNGEELKREIKSHIVRILTEPRSTDMWRQAADRERDAFFGAAGAGAGQAAAPGVGLRPAVVTAGGSGSSAAVKVSDPRVIFVVGVNGVGKTTSIGKLANRLKKQGLDVVLCAADTFRAAAIEQLEIWAQRNGVEVIKQKSGSDPAAVVFDALAAAKARAADAVIVDTAGRLHTKTNLMAELEKMKRTAAKVIPGAPHDILLVMDATTGQNGLSQAREFTASVGVTGIILTKLDGTAKGGIVVAIARELRLPIRFIGTGEQINDMVPFDAQTYADSLFN
jgi:fused signal recognition particle receptor